MNLPFTRLGTSGCLMPASAAILAWLRRRRLITFCAASSNCDRSSFSSGLRVPISANTLPLLSSTRIFLLMSAGSPCPAVLPRAAARHSELQSNLSEKSSPPAIRKNAKHTTDTRNGQRSVNKTFFQRSSRMGGVDRKNA